MLITNRQRRNTLTENDLSLSYIDIELQIARCETILGAHLGDNL